MAVDVSDSSQAVSASCWVDGTLQETTDVQPFTFTIAGLHEGSHEVKVDVRSADGEVYGSSETITVQPDIESEVTAALDAWIDSYRNTDLDAHMQYYGDVVAPFFRRSSYSWDEIRQLKRGVFELFTTAPQMEYSDLQIEVVDENTAVATFDKYWNQETISEEDPGETNHFEGEARERLTFEHQGGQWRIVSEQELEVYYVNKS
jgi:ketosteroid isomerase-like protein